MFRILMFHIFLFIFIYSNFIIDFQFSGVRVNVPVDTLLLTLSATDVDADAAPVFYHLESMQFSRPLSPLLNGTQFSLDNVTGELHTATHMTPFSDGHFTLKVFANNSQERSYATIKVTFINCFLKFMYK